MLSSIIGDMIFIPNKEIEIAGGTNGRKLTLEELQSLKYQLFNDLKIEEPPIKLSSEISYVE